MSTIKVAVLGAVGWMGKTHCLAYQDIPFIFGEEKGTAEVTWLVDGDTDKLANLATAMPNAKTSNNWRDVLNDPEVDLVDICLPDSLHYEVAKDALEAGKHVYCEKPLTDFASEARELRDLARKKNLITRVGHGFMRNPVHDVAKEIIQNGEIGEIKMFRAQQHVDTFGDPAAPFMWRADGKLAPTGIVGDTGTHVFSILDYLVGRVSSLVADVRILTPERPRVEGFNYGETVQGLNGSEERVEVTNADAANIICEFENGAMGTMDFSRTATGRKFIQTYEIYGTKGSLAYNYDEVNRLRFYTNDDPIGRQGFRLIEVGPENTNYKAFLPIPNFALGYNDTKRIEAAEVVESVTTGESVWPTFEDGYRIIQLADACFKSSESRSWVDIVHD